jgi:chromosome segregation protein
MTRDNGAHFFRTDLQVHTPRDGGWKGARPKSDVDRREFASKFVAHCRSVGLNAVAVTDHHDLAFVPYIRAAANTETDASGSLLPEADRLVVFPGIELTLAVPCQAIVVLDADFPDDRLSLVLEALAIDPADPADEVAAATTPLEHLTSLEAVYSTLNQREWLRGRFIVLPNVTDSGHKTLMRPGMHAKYKAMPCVGGYLDGPVTKIGTGNQGIFAGQNKSYGYKPLTVFQTSDARNANFAKLGEPSTWIKWAAPTAEAIRQACLAPESRVSHDDPALPTVFVSRLVVSNSKFLGPVDVYWNRQYNALIGGRGTGKSTLLDYVRWALCDQPPTSDDLEELANPAQRRRRLVEQTLAPFAAVVDVHFTVNGVEHVVRRSAGSGELLLKVSDDDFAPAREADIQALLPVHAYSQKQLSSVAVRVEELRRFIVAPIRQALEGVDAAISETAGRFRENYARRERARALDASISQLKVSEESLSKQASNLRGSLKGLSAEDQALLGRRQSVDAVRETVTRWKQDLEALSGSAGLQLEDLAQAREGQANDTLPDVALSEHGERLRAATAEALAAAERAMKAASDALTSALHPDSARSQAEKTVTGELARFDDEYRAVTARSSAHKASLQTLADLEARRTEVATMLAEQTRERQALGEPDALHAELRWPPPRNLGARPRLQAGR